MTMQPGPQRFGQWLTLVMDNRDISGTAIAKQCRVHDSTVSRWRNGTVTPSMDACILLARMLGVEEPLRIAVTANVVDGNLIGVEPLPMPEPTAQRASVKRQIVGIRGITQDERQQLLEAYDAMGEEK